MCAKKKIHTHIYRVTHTALSQTPIKDRPERTSPNVPLRFHSEILPGKGSNVTDSGNIVQIETAMTDYNGNWHQTLDSSFK